MLYTLFWLCSPVPMDRPIGPVPFDARQLSLTLYGEGREVCGFGLDTALWSLFMQKDAAESLWAPFGLATGVACPATNYLAYCPNTSVPRSQCVFVMVETPSKASHVNDVHKRVPIRKVIPILGSVNMPCVLALRA